MEANTQQEPAGQLVYAPALDERLRRLAARLPRWLGVVDAGAIQWSGPRWFGTWLERCLDGQGVLHRSWVIRLGHTEVTVDFRPVRA